MKKSFIISSVTLGCLALAAGLMFAANGGAPQASITLGNSDAKYCYTHNNLWTLTKEVSGNTVNNGVGTVTWTINATKDSSGPTTFTVHGGLTVTNTGNAPATIGNIVVNLQKPNSPKRGSNAPYVSIAADVANATNGDAATSVKIVAAGSQENAATNAAWGTNNYTVSGAQGTFTETPGSGSLEFTDASDNTIFSLIPQPSIAPGASITLLYDATFNTSVLPPAGTTMRVEALVTFGNAGGRGGSGSTATNIDINGNGVVDPDEANVRTVPTRIVLPALPATPDECNDSVTVTDTGATTTGTVTFSNPVGFDVFPAVISNTGSWDVSVDVDSGADGGNVCNETDLNGAACGGTLNVIVGYQDPPFNTIPIYATFECAPAAEAQGSDCAEVGPPSSCSFQDGDYCTYGKGGYAGPGAPGQLYDNNFLTVFGSGLTIGIDDGAGPKHDAKWNATTTGRANLKTALSGGGASGALTADTVDATSISGGTLSRNTAALALNIGFNAAGITGNGTHTNLGSLTLCNLVGGTVISPNFTLTAAEAAALNGTTISQVLADANNALGGNGLPAYVGSFGDLNELVGTLNGAFDTCAVSAFATTYLCPICP